MLVYYKQLNINVGWAIICQMLKPKPLASLTDKGGVHRRLLLILNHY